MDKQVHCPSCGQTDNEFQYGYLELEGTGGFFPLTCSSCGWEGREWYTMAPETLGTRCPSCGEDRGDEVLGYFVNEGGNRGYFIIDCKKCNFECRDYYLLEFVRITGTDESGLDEENDSNEESEE